MPASSYLLPERPGPVEVQPDVASELLKENAAFYVLVQGTRRLRVEDLDSPLRVSLGDVVLAPKGSSHVLDDGARRALAARGFILAAALRGSVTAPH